MGSVEGPRATCGRCGRDATRVRSRYERRLTDATLAGEPVEIRLQVRRFFCDTAACPARTFVEQVPGLTRRYARHSPPSQRPLERIGLALAGRAGARLADRLGWITSRSSIRRALRALPEPETPPPTVLGVDDFALRRGRHYATVLIDLTTGRPIDVLPDREAATLVGWLAGHTQIQVVCRVRANAYADGVRTGAPQAIQGADRWHLWHNLAEHAEKTVARHHRCLTDALRPPPAPPGPDLSQVTTQAVVNRAEQGLLVPRLRRHHAQVHALREQGLTIKAISRQRPRPRPPGAAAR